MNKVLVAQCSRRTLHIAHPCDVRRDTPSKGMNEGNVRKVPKLKSQIDFAVYGSWEALVPGSWVWHNI